MLGIIAEQPVGGLNELGMLFVMLIASLPIFIILAGIGVASMSAIVTGSTWKPNRSITDGAKNGTLSVICAAILIMATEAVLDHFDSTALLNDIGSIGRLALTGLTMFGVLFLRLRLLRQIERSQNSSRPRIP